MVITCIFPEPRSILIAYTLLKYCKHTCRLYTFPFVQTQITFANIIISKAKKQGHTNPCVISRPCRVCPVFFPVQHPPSPADPSPPRRTSSMLHDALLSASRALLYKKAIFLESHKRPLSSSPAFGTVSRSAVTLPTCAHAYGSS